LGRRMRFAFRRIKATTKEGDKEKCVLIMGPLCRNPVSPDLNVCVHIGMVGSHSSLYSGHKYSARRE